LRARIHRRAARCRRREGPLHLLGLSGWRLAAERRHRIDHVLLSPQAADKLETAVVDKDMRGREKASDHVPVRVALRDA